MMAGVGMANMFMSCICLSFMMGINGTLNTLISQSFGLGNYKLCGIYMNRSRVLVTILYVPLLLILLQTGAIF
jgi:Na+-driven multidrug efflux pump